MENSFLISILSSLSRKEMTYFKEFVFSPYFNKHDDVRSLTDHLSNLYPNFNEKTCHPETIFKAVFRNKKYDKKKLSLIFTYSMRLLEKFMATEIFEEEEYKHKIYTHKYLCKKEKFKHGSKQLNQLKDLLEDRKTRDLIFFRDKLEESRAIDLSSSSQGKILTISQFSEKQKLLDINFLLEKIREVCEQMARDQVLKREISYDVNHFSIREIFENQDKYNEYPSIRVYQAIFKMLNSGEKEEYFNAKNLITQFDSIFSFKEKRTIYTYLSNFCTAQINKGAKEFWNEIFKLYQILLKKETIFEDGFLGEWYYKNIITVGTRLNEREWVENFMEDYKDKLHPDRAENAYSFNKASYFYNIGELEKVLGLLLQVEYNDPRYSVGAKALLLQTYFDMEEDEALFSLADSFRLFLRRNNLLWESRKLGYANLFRLTKRAAKIRAKKGFVSKSVIQKDLEKLNRDYENAGNIYYKNWLGKKIAQIGSN